MPLDVVHPIFQVDKHLGLPELSLKVDLKLRHEPQATDHFFDLTVGNRELQIWWQQSDGEGLTLIGRQPTIVFGELQHRSAVVEQ